MDAQGRRELEDIKRELRSIIQELGEISQGVRRDFEGIGNEQCSACIDKVTQNYETVLRRLNNIDTNTVTDSFARAHGFNGSGGGHSF